MSPRSPQQELNALEDEGLRRRLRPLDSPAAAEVTRDGQKLWNFASNDYLGLASDPRLSDAFVEGLQRFGSGAAASRLITGTLPAHVQFEKQLAAAKESEAALMFSSGFAAAVGLIPAIVGKGDHIVADKLCHACLIDGARLSEATLRVFPHNRIDRLADLLIRIRRESTGRILILTESVFSMDGDLCPLEEIVGLKEEHDALLLLDEAHGFGVLGPSGMGLAEALGLQQQVDFQMGTLSKAAGLSGAYLACSSPWRELLLNRARSFVFSTAPPPALAHAAAASLEIIRTDADLRQRLHDRMRQLDPQAESPIRPLIIGGNQATLEASAALEKAGCLVPAIRYPTVPRGTARLRISLSASHPKEALDQLSKALGSIRFE